MKWSATPVRQRVPNVALALGPALGPTLRVTLGVALALTLGLSGAGAIATAGTIPTASTVAAPAASAAVPTVSIVGISPEFPDAADQKQQIQITVRISNHTAGTFSGLSLRIRRGYPINTEAGLQEAVTTPPATDNVVLAAVPLDAAVLAPGASVRQRISAGAGADGICLCSPGPSVYPLDVVLGSMGTGIELGRAHTFIPSFSSVPMPVQVSWVWPLIDRPHRSTSDSVFFDDGLAESVSPGGRLDRALKVAEAVQGKVRLTLLVDPDLIDSLTVMARGYTVRTSTGTRAGTGGPVAGAWLHRLSLVAPRMDVSITGYADPDIDGLARAGIPVQTALDPQVGDRVRAVLGQDVLSDFAWPPDASLTSEGLDEVVGDGASSVLLSDRSLSGAHDPPVTPDAISPLPSASGQATAFVLSSNLQHSVAAVTGPAPQPSATRVLLAQLAVRAAQNPVLAHYVVLAPTRYVDPSPEPAAAAMLSIAAAPWARDLSIRAARTAVATVDRGTLRESGSGATIDRRQLDLLAQVRDRVAAMRDCLDNADAATLLGGYPAALARAGSASWRSRPGAGRHYVTALRTSADRLISAVSLVAPANSSYTLASADAPLFVTVENRLPVVVHFRIQVVPANGEQGLRADTVPTQTIEAAAAAGKPTRQQVKIPTHVLRTGRFRILVSLLSPRGEQLNTALPLRVRSTALGRAALWITGVAFGVLVLALGIRGIRRLRARTRPRATPRPRPRPRPQPQPRPRPQSE